MLTELRAASRPTMFVVPPPPEAITTVALLPGSFDPPTIAHAALAAAAAEDADLVVLVYSVRAIPKEERAGPPLLPERVRIEALRQLCASRPGRLAMGLCSHGLIAEQVAAARELFPTAPLTLAVGSDKIIQVLDPMWYEDRDAVLDGMLREAEVRYAVRLGEEEAVAAALARPENARWRSRFGRLNVPAEVAAVSSRSVRDLGRTGGDLRSLVPPEILQIVSEHL